MTILPILKLEVACQRTAFNNKVDAASNLAKQFAGPPVSRAPIINCCSVADWPKQRQILQTRALSRWSDETLKSVFSLLYSQHNYVVQAVAYSSHNTAASVVTANKQRRKQLLKEETTLLLAYTADCHCLQCHYSSLPTE